MKKCPQCFTVLSSNERECQICGQSVSPEFDATLETQKFSEQSAAQASTGNSQNGKFVAGTVLANRYRIIGLLGKGGMGEVFKAEDIKLNQTVALKFLPDDLEKDKAALDRFHAEVRNARQVSHPNVCRVFDIGETRERHFLSMEFVDGDDLSSLLRRIGRLPTVMTIAAARFGLLALYSFFLFSTLSRANPITSDFTNWYAGSTFFVFVVLMSLAIYGFYTSIAGQKIFEAKFLEDVES